jgi:DNA-binding NarL/FixJ family response regulator
MGSEGNALVRVLLVEDHEMVATGLRAVLDAEPDIEVIEWARTGAEAMKAYKARRPDAVVMDYRLPDTTGTKVTSKLRDLDPRVRVLLVTGLERKRGVVAEALEAGCSGFVSKERSVAELSAAVRAVANGAAVFPADLLASVTRTPEALPSELTAREREVLSLLADGCTTDEIQQRLFLSLHTVRNHVRNVLNKLHARTKLEAVVIAARSGLVDLHADN